jgi:hypothetical protein
MPQEQKGEGRDLGLYLSHAVRKKKTKVTLEIPKHASGQWRFFARTKSQQLISSRSALYRRLREKNVEAAIIFATILN